MSLTNRKFDVVSKTRPLSRVFAVFPFSLALFCVVPLQSLAQNLPSDSLQDGLNTQTAIPEVLTTTRLRQPKSRVPGTTSIISGDLIRQLGIMNLVEVFRLVPGMTVNYVGSNEPVTSYRSEERRVGKECTTMC